MEANKKEALLKWVGALIQFLLQIMVNNLWHFENHVKRQF